MLSIFAASYSFAEKAGDRAWRPLEAVRHELRLGATLIALAYLDLSRPIASTVVATDASGSRHDQDIHDHGGFGVVSHELDQKTIQGTLQ
eukprot:9469576-Pyramimonas_sp.AAC.1